MMALYDNGTGYFRNGGGWGTAVSLAAVIRNASVSRMAGCDYVMATTCDENANAGRGQFRNEFSDDTGWWAMAWLDAYDRTGQQRYLAAAKADADHMQTFWTSECGGGIRWKEGLTYKASISQQPVHPGQRDYRRPDRRRDLPDPRAARLRLVPRQGTHRV
ncbi:glycoside hydrolase family 76 protein [Amycolatopsis dendrobii]|uniref:Glycosyl hydrolase family 76 n=1 Tax=Amycolatopsis dendrobii TaxID=2760662 RepID=A0A7W3W6M9_9PSEU|nr:glycoside hydrolase family 76 protein [Amycolatopsis dendrobii]MBB1159227.1 hypothetical protein [Amycolatopsis dendrobii]